MDTLSTFLITVVGIAVAFGVCVLIYVKSNAAKTIAEIEEDLANTYIPEVLRKEEPKKEESTNEEDTEKEGNE